MSDKKHPRNTANYKSLPFNPKLKEYAKNLRKAGNLAEVLFWKEVQKGKFLGLDFDRQKIIGNYIADFYCASAQVVIEIDGSSHTGKEDYDFTRDEFMKSLGLTIIRISDKRVKKEMNAVLEFLKAHDKFENYI
jgi:very-short-patch-repair endonuclease